MHAFYDMVGNSYSGIADTTTWNFTTRPSGDLIRMASPIQLKELVIGIEMEPLTIWIMTPRVIFMMKPPVRLFQADWSVHSPARLRLSIQVLPVITLYHGWHSGEVSLASRFHLVMTGVNLPAGGSPAL